MSQVTPSSKLVLYVWPGQWGLPSFDPLCLATILYLQLAIPEQFTVSQCSDPDVSPNGQLPFLVHDEQVVVSFPSIIKYVVGLGNSDPLTYPNANLDGPLEQLEKAQKQAWCAHVNSDLGDLVYHTLYSVHENWVEVTHPALVSMLPVPQRYYVPDRIRSLYKPRLETSGLWSHLVNEKNPEKNIKSPSSKPTLRTPVFTQVFEQEKVAEKTRSTLSIYQRLLGSKDFVYQHFPTSLDVLIAAHILLLVKPPYPSAVLKNLVKDSFPTLALHAQRIYERTLGPSHPVAGTKYDAISVEMPTSWKIPECKPKIKSLEDIYYDRMRWAFFGLSIGSLVAYLVVVGAPVLKQLRLVQAQPRSANDIGVDLEDAEDLGERT